MNKLGCAFTAGLACALATAAPLAADSGPAVPGNEACHTPEAIIDGSASLAQEREQRALLTQQQGKKIGAIHFSTVDVFNEQVGESNWLYRLANTLHIDTRQDVLKSQLLFSKDEPLDAGVIAETERLLRGRSYLANAHISLSLICPDYVELTVNTQDAWTTEPQISVGRSGGETHSGFAVSEDNFLGTGSSVSVGYREDADRSGISYYFSSPHFLNSRLRATFGYSDNSDGEDTLIDVAYPFYSLGTPYSYGFRSEQITQQEPIRYKGEIIEEFHHGVEGHEIYFGRALSIRREHTHRLLAGVAKEKDTFAPIDETINPVPADAEIVCPWLEYQYIENQFAVYRNLDQIQRTEDVPMGKELTFRLGYGDADWGNEDHVLRYQAQYSDVLEVSEHHILRLAAHLDGKRHSQRTDVDTAVIGGALSYYFLSDANNRWFARLRYDAGRDLRIHEKLTVGGVEGVRGYPLDYQRGNRRYVFSLERRYFSTVHLFNLFRLGGVAFFDAGRAWGGGPDESPEHLSNVGVGLRLSSTKARVGHVVHIDLAVPTADKADADSVQWLLTAERAF